MTGCQEQQYAVTQLTIFGPEGEIIQVITDLDTLTELNSLWHDRITVSPSAQYHFTHKLNLIADQKSTLWLYDPAGYTTLLSKKLMPIYQFNAPERLKEVLIPPHSDINSAALE